MDRSWLDEFFGRTLAEPGEMTDGTRKAAVAKARHAAALSHALPQGSDADAERFERESVDAFLAGVAAARRAAPADLVDAALADAAANLPAQPRRADWREKIAAILPRPARAGWIGGALASAAVALVFVIGEFREITPPETVNFDHGKFDDGTAVQPGGSGGSGLPAMPIPAKPITPSPAPVPPRIVLPGNNPPPSAAPAVIPPAPELRQLLDPETADLPATGPRAFAARRGQTAPPQTTANGCASPDRPITDQADNGTTQPSPPPVCPPPAFPGINPPAAVPAIPASPPNLDLPLASVPLPQ